MLEHLRAPFKKTYRAIRQGTGIPWPDSECGDGYWRYWNHCGGFRHWHYGMVVRRAVVLTLLVLADSPGWLSCGTDHGRHPIPVLFGFHIGSYR